jgi:hypothetical protein
MILLGWQLLVGLMKDPSGKEDCTDSDLPFERKNDCSCELSGSRRTELL